MLKLALEVCFDTGVWNRQEMRRTAKKRRCWITLGSFFKILGSSYTFLSG